MTAECYHSWLIMNNVRTIRTDQKEATCWRQWHLHSFFSHTYSLQDLTEIMGKEKKRFGMRTEETP